MSKHIPILVEWATVYGKRPMGEKERPSLYGLFNEKPTYLARCPCGNPRCNALISRFVESDTVCVEQTIALYLESVNLLNEYVNRFSKLVFSRRWDIKSALWCDAAKQILEYSGRVSFYQEEETKLWKWHFAECRLIVALIKMYEQSQQPQFPLLSTGKPDDDSDGIPTIFTDNDWWKNLFADTDEKNED